MAKQIKTRLLLKYDTYQNWTNEEVAGQGANLVLLKGEIGLCAIETGVTTAPTVLFKVGDGTTPFKELKWASALAADVYAWAKQAELPVERADAEGVDAGNVISSIRFEDGKIKYTTTTVATSASVEDLTTRVKAIEDAKFGEAIADINAALELKANANDVYTKTEVDTKVQEAIATAAGDATSKADTALQSAKGYTDTLANGQVKTNKENIATLAEKVETLEVTGGQANVLEGVQVNGTDLSITDKKVNIDLANATVAKAGDADKLGGVAATDYATKTALADKADKSTVNAMYTNAQIDNLIQGAKDYADANDANDNTEYHVEYDSTNKKIKLVAGADADKMEIDATDFIKDGMIDTVTIGADNDLIITFNTAAGKDVIILPLDQLVDIYTGVAGAKVTVDVSADKKISANIVAGSIAKTDLAADVQASLALADTALQEHQDISHLASKTDVVVALAEAEAYADDNFLLKTEYKEYDDTALSSKVTALETAVGNENSGLVKDMADLETEVAKKLDANGWSTQEGQLAYTTEDGDTLIELKVDGQQTGLSIGAGLVSVTPAGFTLKNEDNSKGITWADGYVVYAEMSDPNDMSTLQLKRILLPFDTLANQEAGTLALTSDIETAIENLDLGDKNVIESVKVNNTALEVTDKAVNIDLTGYVAKTEAPGYGDILTKTDAASTYRAKADKITSDDLSDEVWIFNCGSATEVID